MFSGRAKAQVIDVARRLDEVHNLEARRDYPALLRLAAECPITQEAECPNTLFHGMAGWLFWQCFSGMPATYGYRQYGGSFIQQWYLHTYSIEPGWLDDWANSYYRFLTSGTYDPPYYATAYHHKVSSQEIETHRVYSESLTTGKRAIYRTFKFLWLTAEANSPNIRGMAFGAFQDYNYYNDGNREGNWRASGRVNFKDSSGNPITLLKDSSKLLLLEYTMRLMSL